jgi:hypothetical protein
LCSRRVPGGRCAAQRRRRGRARGESGRARQGDAEGSTCVLLLGRRTQWARPRRGRRDHRALSGRVGALLRGLLRKVQRDEARERMLAHGFGAVPEAEMPADSRKTGSNGVQRSERVPESMRLCRNPSHPRLARCAPSKLVVRVRFPSPAPLQHARRRACSALSGQPWPWCCGAGSRFGSLCCWSTAARCRSSLWLRGLCS